MQRALGAIQQQLSQLASLVLRSSIMRPKRTRQSTKQHQDNEFVDLDSDEFEQALAGDDAAAGPVRKRQKNSSSSGTVQDQAQLQAQEAPAAPPSTAAAEPAAAAAVVDLLQGSDGEEYAAEQQEEEELEELVECSSGNPALQDRQDAAAAGSDSNSDTDSAGNGSKFDYSEEDDECEEAAAAASKQRSKQPAKGGKKKQKQKKPRKKRQSTRRLCASFAKAQYRLTDADLKQLTDIVYEPNPHYPGGYPMKLYLVRELEELAQAKQERKAQLAETREERAAARALETRARKMAAAAAAAEAAQCFDCQPQREGRHGSLQLPDTCLANIMACLAQTMEPGGLRGPSCVAKELAQASLACWDFYHAARHGFQALAEATGSLQQRPPSEHVQSKALLDLAALPGPAKLGGWVFWDSVVQQPTSLKLPQLKDAARQLGVMVTGTKAELVLRLLGAFGLTAPSKAPAQLLRALLLERSKVHDAWDGPNADQLHLSFTLRLSGARAAGHPEIPEAKWRSGVAGLRAAISAAGYTTFEAFLAAAKAAQEAESQRLREEAARRAAELAAAAAARRAARQQPGPLAQLELICACGNKAAAACTRRCCGICCKREGGCFRHRL